MDLGSLHPLPYESIHPVNKQEIARRISLGMRAASGDAAVVYKGPHSPKAIVGSGTITVEFETAGLSLNASAACPSVVLNVYCRRAQTLGFEVFAAAAWHQPTSAALSADKHSVVLKISSSLKWGSVSRVRYAYSDWPVVSLRNALGGLPAEIFDIPVLK